MKNKNKEFELPDSMTLEVSGVSGYGDLMAIPVDIKDFKQKIYVMANHKIKPALEVGDKFVANMSKRKEAIWAKPVVRIFRAGVVVEKVYGVVILKEKQKFLQIAEKNSNLEFLIEEIGSAEVGDYVSAELFGPSKFKKAKVLKSFGKFDLNKATATMILEKYDISNEFSKEVASELEKLPNFDNKKREDYTHLPFVTIDGDDSKDFDDAIYIQKTGKNFEVMVAIADVSFYVKKQTNLDREAYKRGNSVYLPNIVVPMLPEILSNDLCSLRPKEVRPVMVCLITIDEEGKIINYDFKRGLIKSFARLTYKEVQNAIDGEYSSNIMPVFKSTIQPAYEAFFALEKDRKRRGALELVSNEIKIKLDKSGKVMSVSKYEELVSNKIIENFMILANVCAAKALKSSKIPVMYRIHEPPMEEKLVDIKPLLKELGMKLSDSPAITPHHFNKILEISRQKGFADGISDLILRLQSQAKYSPINLKHFGLALDDYAHFTSPIRRYSDLLVHRALVKLYNMPEGGALEDEATIDVFKEIGEHLCVTERKAISAERELVARFLATYLEPSIGQDFEVKVTGFSMAGMFVQIESLGVEGLIPMRTLPNDHYEISVSKIDMIGLRSKRRFVLGGKLMAKLEESSPVTGGMIFKYIDKDEGVNYIKKEDGRGRFGKKDRNDKKSFKPAKKDKKPSDAPKSSENGKKRVKKNKKPRKM